MDKRKIIKAIGIKAYAISQGDDFRHFPYINCVNLLDNWHLTLLRYAIN